jgi:DNA repair protein RecO (recombination protein O)
LKSYFVRDAFSGRKSIKIAYFQPLTILEIEAVHKNKGTLENFKEIKSLRLFIPFIRYLQKHHGDVYLKCCIIPFMKRKKTNHFYLLETALHWLDNHDEIANFHLILLLETTKYLGFTLILLMSICLFFEIEVTPFHAVSSLTEHESNLFKKTD